MIAKVIDGGDASFNAIMYGAPRQDMVDYCQSTINDVRDRVGDAGKSFYNKAVNTFNSFNNNAVINAARAVVSKAHIDTNEEIIHYLDRDSIGNAKHIMQRYVMVQPDLFDLNRDQMCSSYEGEYYDRYPYVKKVEDHNDYRRATDGMLQHTKKGDAFIKYFSDEEDKLNTFEQFDIARTWDTVLRLIADGKDPSSPDEDDL